jgi:hypothetical protein
MRNRFLVVLGVQVFVVFLVVAVLGLFLLYPSIRDRTEARLREEGRLRAKVIVMSVADRCVEPIIDGDELLLGLIVAKATKDYEGLRWVSITDTAGVTIAHTDLKLLGKKIMLPPGIQPRKEGDFRSSYYGGESSWLWASYPISIGQSTRGIVHLGMLTDAGTVAGEIQAVRTRAVLTYVGLGAICALLLMIFSYGPIRSLRETDGKAVAHARAMPAREGLEEELLEKKREETAISERITKMRDKEKELVKRLKALKKQAQMEEMRGDVERAPEFVSAGEKREQRSESPGPIPRERALAESTLGQEVRASARAEPVRKEEETESKSVSEKEKIEAIRKRIHELEERIRRK